MLGFMHTSLKPTNFPDGLVMASVDDSTLLQDALNELAPRFRACSVVEIGVSYKILESKHRRAIGIPVSRTPAVRALIASAMAALQRKLPDNSDARLNMICRSYGPGDRLSFHRDSIGLFGEEVFGAVLASQGRGLVFRQGAAAERKEFCLSEFPGLVFASGGPSRYLWSHGVLPCPEGSKERVSVTWRWVRSSVLVWFSLAQSERDRWVAQFVKSARQAAVSEGHIAAFLCESSAWYVTKNDRMGPLLPIDATARALEWQGSGTLPEPEVSSRTPLRLETSLDLLQCWEASLTSPHSVEAAEAMESHPCCTEHGARHSRRKGKKVKELLRVPHLVCHHPNNDWEMPDIFEESDAGHSTTEHLASRQRNAFAALADQADSASNSS